MAKIILIAVFASNSVPNKCSREKWAFSSSLCFSEHCVFCKAWERDVGRLYGDTEYAKKAPLFRIDISLFANISPM